MLRSTKAMSKVYQIKPSSRPKAAVTIVRLGSGPVLSVESPVVDHQRPHPPKAAVQLAQMSAAAPFLTCRFF